MRRFNLLLILTALLGSSNAMAEGSNELGLVQVQTSTELGVDILFASETLVFEGTGRLTITDSTGATVASLSGGQSHTFAAAGRYGLALSEQQSGGWSITVSGAAGPESGRIFATRWDLEGESRGGIIEPNLYVAVPGGGVDEFAVIEAQLLGVKGAKFSILANASGPDGTSGRSVPRRNNSATPAHRVYLNPPADASYTATTPTLSNLVFDGGQGCPNVAAGTTRGNFEFDTNVEGTYRIVCDIDADGVYDPTSKGDLVLTGPTTPGLNRVEWDGTSDGLALQPDEYRCQATVSVGETHLVLDNVQMLFPGLRFFELDSALVRTGLSAFWNDESVQSRASSMPNGDTSPDSSGAAGISAGLPTDATMAHGVTRPGNARAWGTTDLQPPATTKGLETFMNTWTELDSASAEVAVTALNPEVDSDGDGLSDVVEKCVIGSDPELADTDGDGVPDDVEVSIDGGTPEAPADTDRDGLPDVLDPDDDGDGIPTFAEDADGDGDPTNDDFDRDELPNYRDVDSDGDGILDSVECPEPTAEAGADICRDTDGDGVPDFLQLDSDDDGIPDATEGHDANHDGEPDVKPTGRDSDGDGIDDAFDDNCRAPAECPADGVPAPLPDLDGDGLPDYIDTDSDGDGVPDSVECGSPDGNCDDANGNGIPDYLDDEVPGNVDDPEDPEDPEEPADPTDPIDENPADANDEFAASGGGCSAAASSPGALPFLMLLLLGVIRRRT